MIKPVGFTERLLPGELKVAMDWRKMITGVVGIRRWQPAQLGQLEPRDISGTNGQSTILHWPLICPANGVHLTRLNCPPSPCGRLPGSYLDLPAKNSRFSLIRPTILDDTQYGEQLPCRRRFSLKLSDSYPARRPLIPRRKTSTAFSESGLN